MSLKDSTIVIALLARDCATALKANIQSVELLGSMFKEYHVMVYENNSVDGTKEVLADWQRQNSNVTAIMEDLTEEKSTERLPYPEKSTCRIQKMVHCRNRILEETRKRFEPDLFCLIDIDIERFDAYSIVNAIENAPADWGGIFANGAYYARYSTHEQPHYLQYDTYAYVDQGVDPMKSKDWITKRDYHLVTASRMTWKLRHHPYVPCQSAFGGIGVYRWNIIKEQNYATIQTPELKPVRAALCEHVPFNTAITKKGYANYIARDMKVVYGTEPAKEKKGINRWQNHYRALYYFHARPRKAVKTLWHIVKERLGMYPYAK